MKYIMTINELFRSTYLSAANKLKNHPDRSKDLKDWADKGGLNYKFSPTEKDYPHRFTLGNIKGYFMITHNETNKDGLVSGSVRYIIYMKSNYSEIRVIEMILNKGNNNPYMRICSGDSRNISGMYCENFLFTNRTDAMHIKKYLLEVYDISEYPNEYKIIKNIKLNDLYRSEVKPKDPITPDSFFKTKSTT
jgi:hypothetical protein